MMISIPNGKVLNYDERAALVAFVQAANQIKVVSRRDSIELHQYTPDTATAYLRQPDAADCAAPVERPEATAVPSTGTPTI